MQKRLLALVATVAVVLSMFTGIVFAAADDVKITTPLTVDKAGLLTGKVTVEGATTDVNGALVTGTSFDPVIDPAPVPTYTRVGETAEYSVSIPLSDTLAPGDYTLSIKKDAGVAATSTFNIATSEELKLYTDKVAEADGKVDAEYTTASWAAFSSAYAECAQDLTKMVGKTALNAEIGKIQFAMDLLVSKTALTATVSATRAADNKVNVTGTTNATTATYTITGLITNQPLTITEGAFAFTLPASTPAGEYSFVVNSTMPADLDPATKTVALTVPAVTAPTPTGVHSIKLSKDKIISSFKTPDVEYVAVRILKDDKGVTDNYEVKVFEATDLVNPLITATATAGYANLVIPSNLDIQDLTVKAYLAGVEVAKETIMVRYNVSVSPSLEFSFSEVNAPVYIKGKVTDRYGNPVYESASPTTITITGPNGPVVTSPTTIQTNANGEFGFVVNGWGNAGAIKLFVTKGGAPQQHLKGKVIPQAASITVTPASAVHSVNVLPFEVAGSGFVPGEVTFTLEDANEDPAEGFTSFKATILTGDKLPANTTFNWMPKKAGTFTLIATQANYEATATITVTNPATYNLIGEDALKTLKVGTDNFHFGTGSTSGAEAVKLLKYVPGETPTSNFLYTVVVDGKTKLEKKDSGLVEIESTKLETRKIQVIAYNNDADQKEVFNQTYTAKVTGWDVELDINSLTVNEAQSLSFVIKDEDGLPVNNATIQILNTAYKLSPLNYNAQAGVYVLKDVKIAKPGTYTIQVRLGDGVDKIKAELDLDVVGKQVWNVSSDVATLLQGKTQAVKFTITQDSKSVAPARVKLVDKDGVVSDANFSFVSDGVYKINVKALKAGKLIARFENFDGTLCGEAELDVVAPKLVLIDEDAANVTENFKTAVKFKVIDPRDDSVLKNEITIVANKYVGELEVLNASGNPVPVVDKEAIIAGAEEYALSIFAKDANYKQAEKDEKTVAVQIKVLGVLVNGSFKVKPATITSSPEMIVIGANNNLTLTYKDANGKVLADRTIKAGDVNLGKTDENGQVIYPVGVAAAPVTLKGATDVKDVVVEKVIKIGYDAEAPKVTYEIEGNKATIVISDNVRLVRINIDGEEIDFWPGAKYEFVRTLKPGVNKFAIKAQDSNDNVFNEIVEIEYVTDSTVLEGEQVKRQGEFVFVQVRQFEELGAKVGWKQDTKTATFIVGETKVEVVIGSLTAKVNGEAVTMPAAPFIANDRTYVPTRFIAEALGWNVHWAAGDIITITLP